MAWLIYYQKLKNYVNIEQENLLYFQLTNPYYEGGKANFYIKNSNNETIYTDNNLYPTIEANNERKYYFDNNLHNNILVNGNTYTFYFKLETNSSYDKTTVICLSPPIFTLSGITPTLNNQSSAILTVTLNNLHSDDYLINFKITLDDNIIYNNWNKSWISSNFNIDNLTDGEHNIKVYGTSYLGFSLYAELSFEVVYSSIHILFAFTPENIYEEGKVKISSDVINIAGKSLSDVTYINNMVDLTNNKVMFDEGFTVDENFYIKVHVKNLAKNTKQSFLTIYGNNTRIDTYFKFNNYDRNSSEGVEKWAYYVELKVNYNNIVYTIVSNYILEDNYNSNGMYFIGIKRQDNYYELYIEEVVE